MGALDDLADRLEAAAEALVELGPDLAAGEPWALTEIYGPGPESSWGPREVLAHVAEMVPYWMGQIELILDAGESLEPREFGRTEADDLRVGIIGRDRMFPARELLGRIEVEAKRVARRFRALSEADAGLVGRHPRRGDVSIRELAESFITGHAEGHVTQLREILAAR
jgi:DinB family protein